MPSRLSLPFLTGELTCFPNADFKIENLINKVHRGTLKTTVKQHLVKLKGKFCEYFPDENRRRLYTGPLTSGDGNHHVAKQDDQLVELSFERGLSMRFPEMTLQSESCYRLALPISESSFSAMAVLKTKSRNKLDSQHDLRVALSTITPDINKLIKLKKHPQDSH
jgi:hypothetical protein